MASLIVPAHDEERTIAGCLESLIAQAGEEDEIVVVCNGCADRTAEVASAFGPPVTVVEISAASKSLALNTGDDLARSFPRVYVDADVELSPGTIPSLRSALSTGKVDLVSAAARHDLTQSSRLVVAYYRIWSRLPSVREDTVGSGVYALSASGRSRFSRFPDADGDDHFVRDRIPPDRRAVVADARSTVRAPRTLPGLVRRSVRHHAGNRALDRTSAEGRRRARQRRRQWAGVAVKDPRLWPAVPVYLFVALAARALAGGRRNFRLADRWLRDDSRR